MAKTKKTKTTNSPAAGAEKNSEAKKQTASDFIRAQPATMKAAEVVEAGTKAGFKISTGLVYMVRSRVNKGAPARKRGRPRKDASTAAAPTLASTRSAPGGDELALARLILNLGFARAEGIFQKL